MRILLIILSWLLVVNCEAWTTIRLDVPQGANEAAWRDALAAHLHGTTEVIVPYGRVDVLTRKYALELDFLTKFHECLGQALHYASETGKQGIGALIVKKWKADTQSRLRWIENLFNENGVQLFLLIRKGEK